MKTLNNKMNGLKLTAVCGLAFHLIGFAHVATAKQTTTGVGTSIAFTVADGTTVYKSKNPVLPVQAVMSDPAGIQSVNLSSSVGAGTGRPNGAKSCAVGTTLFGAYYPIGDYRFTAAATNLKGVKTTKFITIHMVK